MMKPHHPQNRKKEGKKREEGRRDWEEGENGGKEKGRKRKIKLIHVDLEEPEPGEHLAKPLGGGAAAADTIPGTKPPPAQGRWPGTYCPQAQSQSEGADDG